LRARQVGVDDFRAFDRLVALDRSNLDALRALAPDDGRAELSLLLDHVAGREGEDVADPYFGGDEGFEQAWRDIGAGVDGLLAEIGCQPSL
jgi:protein-tyrosine phosphatase